MADGIVGKISVGDGATFTPSVSSTGVLSWSNNKALANPDDFDIPEEVLNRAGAMGLATETWVSSELSKYLPLAGGTVTGNAIFNARTKFKSSIDFFERNAEHGRIYDVGNVFRFTGGTSTSDGSYIDLSYTGGGTQQFRIVANDGTTQKMLVGKPDGTLTWDNNNIALAKDYLPVTGGTLSGWLQFSNEIGRIQINRSNTGNDGAIQIYGGSGYSTGAYLWLNGIGRASTAGGFGIRAVTDGSTYKELQGNPDGTLTWNGKNLKPNLVKMYESATGASAGDTVSLEKIATDFATFIVMVSDDLTDGAGSAFGIFCTRMKGNGEGSQFGSNIIRGGNMLNYSTSDVDMRMISIGISFNNTGTEATISYCSMVRINGTTNTFNARKVYAIYGMHLKSTIE